MYQRIFKMTEKLFRVYKVLLTNARLQLQSLNLDLDWDTEVPRHICISSFALARTKCWDTEVKLHIAAGVLGKIQPKIQKDERWQQYFTLSAISTTDIKICSDVFFTSTHIIILESDVPPTEIQERNYISHIVKILTFDSSHIFEWEEGIKCQNQKWVYRTYPSKL